MHPVSEALLRWYDENARQMPWRGIRDPYGIWVSEIMLQQTRVETVRDYYPRFMDRFPTLKDLAEAPEEDVLKMWEGLGYYSRARNLQQGARQVIGEFGGVIPDTPEKLRKIRGIGPYTSCSIASIAFGVPVPAVDGNVIRVICRLYDLRENPEETGARRRVEGLAAELVPPERAGDHNQAMMDLGATVCVPGTPDCGQCPLRDLCLGRAAGTADRLPALPGKNPPKELAYDVPLVFSGDRVLMYCREEKMLHGLWCFPLMEGHRPEEEMGRALKDHFNIEGIEIRKAGEARHVFTHQVWRMNLYEVQAADLLPAPEGYAWIPPEEVQNLPLPTAMRAAREIVEQKTRRGEAPVSMQENQKIEKNREKRRITEKK